MIRFRMERTFMCNYALLAMAYVNWVAVVFSKSGSPEEKLGKHWAREPRHDVTVYVSVVPENASANFKLLRTTRLFPGVAPGGNGVSERDVFPIVLNSLHHLHPLLVPTPLQS